MKNTIVWGLVLGAMTAISCGTSKPAADSDAVSDSIPESPVFTENDGIFYYRIGNIEVYMLVEAQREGNAGILVGANEALLAQYIPQSGFSHSTNVFLVKVKGQTVLIDTGFGTTIFDKMKKLGVEPDQVNAVLLTHLHGDHIGGIQKDGTALFPNAKVYLASMEREYFTELQVNAGAVAALAPYSNKVINFEPSWLGSKLSELIPGFFPIASFGHTPGHTAYLVEDSGNKFLIAGDFLHVALVQFPNPNISATYDVDQKAAAASRRQIMDYAAQNNIPIGGMHMVYPGIGTVQAEGNGFKFTPAQ